MITMKKESFYSRLKNGLGKTKNKFLEGIEALTNFNQKIDDEFFDELEECLISADMGVSTVVSIVDDLRDEAKKLKLSDASDVEDLLKQKIVQRMSIEGPEEAFPKVLLLVGVNGAGKTTTAGKIASLYQTQGKSVTLAAADTFRAAASNQLKIWAERTNVGFIGSTEGADPSSVLYDGIDSAIAKKTDVLICDTAGRLHNKKNLMNELEKMNRVIEKKYPQANKEVLLVVDAVTGQNALSQAELFNEAANLDGVVLTKLDGTAKGGIAVALCDRLKKPIKFIGVGEKIEDLNIFKPADFVEALFER